MVKVAIVGASGYTGGELVRFLCRHPQVTISCITDLSHAGRPLAEIYPQFRGLCDLTLENLTAPEVARRAEIVFLAVPHKAAMGLTPTLLDGGCRVVDLSADFRLKDQAVYEAWYQEEHVCPQLLAEAVYGLPELNREAVRTARLVANPGCYPTSAGLALLPLLEQRLIDPASIIIDSKSGATGAGRTPTAGNIFCEVNEAFKAYGVASHRHTPEIEQTLSQAAGAPVTVNFTPHLLPISRGILTTVYASLQPQADPATLLGLFAERYADHPFVRVLPAGQLPNVSAVRGSNFCDIGLVADPRTGRVIVVSAIDNLAKGASGQAIQNMNLMCGLDERTGLEVPPLAP